MGVNIGGDFSIYGYRCSTTTTTLVFFKGGSCVLGRDVGRCGTLGRSGTLPTTLFPERPSYDRPLKKRPAASQRPTSFIENNINTHKYETNDGSTIYNNDMLVPCRGCHLVFFPSSCRGTLARCGTLSTNLFPERPSYERPLKKRATACQRATSIEINIHTHKIKDKG